MNKAQQTSDFLISLFEEAGIDIFANNVDLKFLVQFAKVIDLNLKRATKRSDLPKFETSLEGNCDAESLIGQLKSETPNFSNLLAKSILDFKLTKV